MEQSRAINRDKVESLFSVFGGQRVCVCLTERCVNSKHVPAESQMPMYEQFRLNAKMLRITMMLVCNNSVLGGKSPCPFVSKL